MGKEKIGWGMIDQERIERIYRINIIDWTHRKDNK